MTRFDKKHLVQLGTSMLATGAFLLPTLSVANAPAAMVTHSQAAPTLGITKVAAESPAPNDFRKLKKSVSKLNLTAEQQKEIDALISNAQPQAAQLQKEMRNVMTQMRELMFPENNQYDAKEVSLLADKQGKLVTQMLELRAKVTFEVYSKLTPEQKQQLRAQWEEKGTAKKKRDH